MFVASSSEFQEKDLHVSKGKALIKCTYFGSRKFEGQQKEKLSIVRPTINSDPAKEGPAINENIEAENVRLVLADGDMAGVVSKEEAINRAFEAGLDLVAISPNADPPVCKILDYGKFKYEAQKKKKNSLNQNPLI